jgi:hypothetical protein
MTTTLRPFRDYSEHEVINLFALNGEGNKGMFVTAVGEGFKVNSNPLFDENSNIDGAVSSRFNVPHLIAPAPSGTPRALVLGMTLKDVRSKDENGYPLKWEPSKAAERDLIVSGQAVPVVKRGIFLYSGIEGDCQFGSSLLISDSGDGSLKVSTPSNPAGVAKALGPKDANGFALIQINL